MNELQTLESERRQAEASVAQATDSESRATRLLELGCLLERLASWEEAAVRYRELLACGPRDPVLNYYGRNNLAYCLLILGDYDGAEELCRSAIEINQQRHNAHKNLGLALVGQGRWLDGAYSLLAAIELAPADRRALGHLEHLMASHPAVFKGNNAFANDMRRVLDQSGARSGVSFMQ